MTPIYQVYFVGFNEGSKSAGGVRGPYSHGDVFQHKEACEALRYDHDEIVRVRMRGTHDWAEDQKTAKARATELWNKD